MDISLVLKVAGVGILVAVSAQILSKYGRDDQATLVGIAGMIAVLWRSADLPPLFLRRTLLK